MKILIADDDPVSRRLIERILQKSGYEVVTAENGVQALDALFRPDGPRLALLDWVMPEKDGLEVCREVRSRESTSYIYITLLTSKLSQEDVVAGLEAGSDDYLTKPCNPDELKARLRTGQRILQLEDRLVEAREEMRFRATHDAMTGLLNQSAILDSLRRELEKPESERLPLALLLCDVDYFKRINDTHGHLAGDEMLRQVATRLREAVEPIDAVGRYGGEEFLLLLKACQGTCLSERAERVRNEIGSRKFLVDNEHIGMSLSIGALAIEGTNTSLSIETLLKKVDAAMYVAKVGGRNRVVFADPSGI